MDGKQSDFVPHLAFDGDGPEHGGSIRGEAVSENMDEHANTDGPPNNAGVKSERGEEYGSERGGDGEGDNVPYSPPASQFLGEAGTQSSNHHVNVDPCDSNGDNESNCSGQLDTLVDQEPYERRRNSCMEETSMWIGGGIVSVRSQCRLNNAGNGTKNCTDNVPYDAE